MGTRSIVGFPHGDGVKGRYCHWDGYPTGVGSALWRIIERDGADKARFVLTEQHYGWSSVNAEDVQDLDASRGDGRFVGVPGYGIAYTTEQDQSSPDWWCYAPKTEDGDNCGTEYGYAIGPKALTVFKLHWDDREPPKCLGVFRYDAPEPDWAAVEGSDDGEE